MSLLPAAGAPVKPGSGTRMLDNMRKKGQPITPQLQEMANWLDSLETNAGGMDGEVIFQASNFCSSFIDCQLSDCKVYSLQGATQPGD